MHVEPRYASCQCRVGGQSFLELDGQIGSHGLSILTQGYHVDRKHPACESTGYSFGWSICWEVVSFPLHEWASPPQLTQSDYYSWCFFFSKGTFDVLCDFACGCDVTANGAEGREGAEWLRAQKRHDLQYSLTMLNQTYARRIKPVVVSSAPMWLKTAGIVGLQAGATNC